MNQLVVFVAILFIVVLIFIICREIICWYYKINKRVEQNDKIIEQNEVIIKLLNEIKEQNKGL